MSQTPPAKDDRPAPAPEQEAPEIDLRSAELYLNRELSMLEFNRRVLAQARC